MSLNSIHISSTAHYAHVKEFNVEHVFLFAIFLCLSESHVVIAALAFFFRLKQTCTTFTFFADYTYRQFTCKC